MTISKSDRDGKGKHDRSTAAPSDKGGEECELDIGFAEHRADLAAGRFVEESVRQHRQRLATMM